MDVPAFLRRIGLPKPGKPDVEWLFRLHAAYVESVPYESIQFQLGGRTPLDPFESAERIIAGRTGGYCFQINGALSVLLEALGYRVTRHRGGVHTSTQAARVDSSHLVLTVSGLPDAPGTTWLVDAGLGDGLHVPLPLRAGVYDQRPFTFGLRRSEVVPDGWRLDHDETGGLIGMDFDNAPAVMSDFARQHAYLSESPESPFVRVCSAFIRTPGDVHILRGLSLSTPTTAPTLLEAPAAWFTALADVFHLPLQHLSPTARQTLWRRALAQHEAWAAAQHS
ncbi:arylamine N-acetyltransferase family protein [Kribbella deserti]|uniref:Arylamine N-acetyltransferase n=1 Tax=Kribbella deserti TaxID=1926257 RepID=A0ABV6QWW9_9ACTN